MSGGWGRWVQVPSGLFQIFGVTVVQLIGQSMNPRIGGSCPGSPPISCHTSQCSWTKD